MLLSNGQFKTFLVLMNRVTGRERSMSDAFNICVQNYNMGAIRMIYIFIYISLKGVTYL